MLLTALNAMFLSGDVFNIYVTLELMGLSAVALGGPGQQPGRHWWPQCVT